MTKIDRFYDQDVVQGDANPKNETVIEKQKSLNTGAIGRQIMKKWGALERWCVQDCIKAWKNLVDRYVKEKNRCASGSQASEVTWKYFDAMRFYGKYTKPHKTHTSTRKNPQSGPPPQIVAGPHLPCRCGKSAKRKTTENLPNTFLEAAKEIMQKIDTKQHSNPNRTFCNYLFSELEKLSEAEAKEKRKQILMNVFSD
nr:unnamed protein product [Callosobruchus analis]